MKPRTVLVLALVVAALTAFIWFVERDLPSSDERAELAGKLLAVEPDEVTGLVAEWQGRSARLERRGDDSGAAAAGWWLVEPMSARADGAAVDRLVDAVTALEKKRTLEDAEPEAVGLDAPRARLTLLAGDRQWTLEVGAQVPTSGDVLVSLAVGDRGDGGDGEPGTYVTGAGFVEQIERAPGEWRSRDVFPSHRGAVERVTLRVAGTADPVVLGRRDDRFWLEEPVTDLADAERVDDLLSALTDLSVEEFIDEPADSAGLGLSPPRLEIDVELTGSGGGDETDEGSGPAAGDEPFRLALGAPVAGSDGDESAASAMLYGRAGAQTFTAATELATLAAMPATVWRSPAWTALESFDVEGIEAETPDGSFTLERDGVDWVRDGGTLPYGVVEDLFSALTDARGEVALDADPESGEAELVKLRVAPRDHDAVILTLYAGQGDGHLARSSDRPAPVRLERDAVERILDALAAVRDAEPEPPADEVEAETEDGTADPVAADSAAGPS